MLFKAYDEILPTFGIDPDSDHHLSAFIFRIGGEQGNGSLSDKFQLILGRMGIVLEFGDNSTVSAPTSSTLSTSPSQSHSSRPNSAPKPHIVGPSQEAPIAAEVSWKVAGAPFLANLSVRRHVPPDAPNSDAQNAPLRAYLGHSLDKPDDQGLHGFVDRPSTHPEKPTPAALEEASHNKPEESHHSGRFGHIYPAHASNEPTTRDPGVMSAGDRWRDLARVLSSQRTRGKDALGKHRTAVLSMSTRPDADTVESRLPLLQDPRGLLAPVLASSGRSHAEILGEQDGQMSIASPDRLPEAPVTPLNLMHGEKRTLSTAMARVRDRHADLEDILLHRAARAREIYLASKFFNRWADRTATKLEREAVARRHMIRFRCFQGWSRAPTLKVPAAEHLRATTAVQKLRRAIAYNEEQLSLAAAALAQASQVRMVQVALSRWTCQAAQYTFRRRLASKSLREGIKRWSARARENAVLGRAASSIAARGVELGAVNRWTSHVQSSGAEFAAAQHLAAAFGSTSCLREWVCQVEVSRRAREYRQLRREEQLRTALDAWGLRARVQAYRWRREYLSVTEAFDRWIEGTRREKVAADAAQHHRKLTGVAKAYDRTGRLDRDSLELTRLHTRARLFIRSSRLLTVLDAAVDRRKHRMRSMVRRYLMARYTQMSSKRRKRNFYAALDRWTAASQDGALAAQLAESLHANRAATLCRGAMLVWQRGATDDQQLQLAARGHYKQGCIDAWATLMAQHGADEASAWGVWAAEQQRHSLKAWSIAALQRNGQAHSATVLRQRHARDNRLRGLQQWKRALVDARPGGNGQLSPAATEKFSTRSTNHASWRSVPPRLSYIRREQDFSITPMQTPTRWTGTALPMTSTDRASRFMATVQEADVKSAATSSAAGDAPTWGRISRESVEGLVASHLPSTTPQAPVPTHLERQGQLSLPRARQLSRSLLARSAPVQPISRHARSYQPLPAAALGGVGTPGRSPDAAGRAATLRGFRQRRMAQVAPRSSR